MDLFRFILGHLLVVFLGENCGGYSRGLVKKISPFPVSNRSSFEDTIFK